MNPILLTDSYKVTHWKQYPPKTTNVYSYLESRGGEFNRILFFGLQYILRKFLSVPVLFSHIDQAEELFKAHFGTDKLFNKEGWKRIIKDYGGYLPVEISAIEEGTLAPTHTPLVTVENTDPELSWVTNYIESLLLQVWYPITVATVSYHARQVILEALEETGDPSLIDYKLHDFGFRGVSSVESAGIGGAAHLVNFKGTDTLKALNTAMVYYAAKVGELGHSIPAAEHSTITSWGREHEAEAYENMINQFAEGSMYAVVSDSYNIYKACGDLWGDKLKRHVLAGKNTLVIRPDSGNPPQVISELLTILGTQFGYTLNEKGYAVLHPKVRLIQGDGIDLPMIKEILARMKKERWSSDNIAFGMGGGLLQKVNRDTQQFAFKCSSVVVDGETRDVYKSPITDPGKASKGGRFDSPKLKVVYRNGLFPNQLDFQQIRANAREGEKC